MWRRCAYWSGVLLIAVAVAAVPSGAIVLSYVGGSAIDGHVEDGRYFVNPSHGRPIVEVSESTWRAVYWVERLWPLSILIPGLLGLFLTSCGSGPNGKPPMPPPKELPPWALWACLAGALFTVAATLLFWFAVRVPWATMLFAWILCCISVVSVVWLYSRSLRRQPTAEPIAAAGAEPGAAHRFRAEIDRLRRSHSGARRRTAPVTSQLATTIPPAADSV